MAEESVSSQISLLEERAYLARGVERLELLEEAARLADTINDVETACRLRNDIVDAATWAGYYERALVAFDWMLALYDRDRENFGELEGHLLWLYKWILEDLHRFSSITREQIDRTFADMSRRYDQAGSSQRAVHQLRCMVALEMGEIDKAIEHEKLWQAADEDASGDCPACELDSHVKFYLLTGHVEQAIERAQPLFDGDMECEEVPGITHGRFLVPLLLAGKVEQAVRSQRASFKQMRESRKFLMYQGQHLAFMALTGQLPKAVKFLEARLGWAMETRNNFYRLYFLLGARVVLARLAAERPQIRMQMPAEFPGRREDATYPTADLAQWVLEQCRAEARAFDQRNGNDYYAKLVEANEALVKMPEIALPTKLKD